MYSSSVPWRIDVLVVAEKNSVAKAFAMLTSQSGYQTFRVYGLPAYKYYRDGKLWVSFGVSGHLMDFDFEEQYNNWHAVNPRLLFSLKPIRVVREECVKYVKALQLLGQRAMMVILALDADTEGESIAFEVMDIIRRVNPWVTFKRAWFSAITKKDLEEALRNLREPNPNLANKAFARMQIDLTIGAAFTRALTLLVEKKRPWLLPKGSFLSYGPCQSPVLFLVVQRALEREKFKSEKYYTLYAYIKCANKILKLSYKGGKIKSLDEAKALQEKVKRSGFGVVVKAEYRSVKHKPPEPLNTIELERRASRFLNIRPKEALDIAEELYRDGLISYPRTETTIYPPTLNVRAIASMFLRSSMYGPYVRKLLALPQIIPTRGTEDDKAHPPIYPTKVVSKEYVVRKFGSKGWKLYDFIVRHFLATLSKPAVIEHQTIEVDFNGIRFKTNGLKILDLGYLEIYPYEKPSESTLPRVSVFYKVPLLKVEIAEKKTEPPPYLSEAELLKLMKKYGIGTDATMQDHIHTNIKRNYFYIERKRCIPTPLGKAVATTLYSIVPEIVKPEVRGEIERELQEIALGKRSPEEVVNKVKERFLKYFDRLMSKADQVSDQLIKALEQMYGRKKPLIKRSVSEILSPTFRSAKEYFSL